jgi:hypothetical protein
MFFFRGRLQHTWTRWAEACRRTSFICFRTTHSARHNVMRTREERHADAHPTSPIAMPRRSAYSPSSFRVGAATIGLSTGSAHSLSRICGRRHRPDARNSLQNAHDTHSGNM